MSCQGPLKYEPLIGCIPGRNAQWDYGFCNFRRFDFQSYINLTKLIYPDAAVQGLHFLLLSEKFPFLKISDKSHFLWSVESY